MKKKVINTIPLSSMLAIFLVFSLLGFLLELFTAKKTGAYHWPKGWAAPLCGIGSVLVACFPLGFYNHPALVFLLCFLLGYSGLLVYSWLLSMEAIPTAAVGVEKAEDGISFLSLLDLATTGCIIFYWIAPWIVRRCTAIPYGIRILLYLTEITAICGILFLPLTQ